MITIIGASGFVGSHLLLQLVSEGHKVRAVVREKSRAINKIATTFSFYNKNLLNLEKQIEWIEADVLDPFELLKAFEGTTQLYHCAGFVSFNPAEKRQLWEVNVLGTRNIVNAALAKNVKKLCFLSSIAALGSTHSELEIDEETHWKPDDKHSHYSKAKYEAEQEVWRGMAEGLPSVIINAGVIIGPGTWGETSTALVTALANGMKYYTQGISGYVGVQDVVKLMTQSMNHSCNNQSFIAVAENLSIKNIFTILATALGKDIPQREARYPLLRLLAELDQIRYFFTHKAPRITRSSARTAVSKSYYSNKKACDLFQFTFSPIIDVANFTCRCYTDSIKKTM